MSYGEMRAVSLHAARSYLRVQGIDPVMATCKDAEAALDDICRTDDSLIVYVWWVQCASKTQTRLFRAEWNAWAKAEKSSRFSR